MELKTGSLLISIHAARYLTFCTAILRRITIVGFSQHFNTVSWNNDRASTLTKVVNTNNDGDLYSFWIAQ